MVLLKPERDNDLLYGAEQSALDTTHALARQGVGVEILQWNPSRLPVEGNDVRLSRVRFSEPAGFLKLTSSVVHSINRNHPSAVYAYADCFEETFVSAFLGSLVTGTKFLLCVPDDESKEIDAQSLPKVFAIRHASGHSFRSSISFTFYHATRRFAARTTAVCLVTATSVRDYARTMLKARRVFLVPLGVDKLWFGRTSNLRRFDAIYVGGLWPEKRVDVLVKAWKEIARRRPDAKLLILGEGGEKPGLERLASELGISGSIAFKNYVLGSKDVHEMMSESRIFVSASVWEGWSRVVTEAMATGLPCVLSDISVFKELYSDTAVIVPKGSPNLFAEAVLNLLEDGGKYLDLACRGAKQVEGLTWDAVARRLLWVIQNT